MDRIVRLRIFVRVVDCKSFTKAAETLAMPRSTVSIAIKELEKLVGARLLCRTTRSVTPTHDGTVFYQQCSRLVEDYEEVEGLFRTAPAKLSGRLKVNVPGRIGRMIIAPALPEFLAAYPNIALEIGITDRTVDLQQEGIDCVVRVGDLAVSNLIARRIGDLDIINCASRKYLDRYGVPVRPQDLRRHRAITYVTPSGGKAEPWQYADAKGVQSIDVPPSIAVDNAEMLIACCLAGLGLIQVPAYDVRDHIERGELVKVLPNHCSPSMPIHIVYPHRHHVSGRLQAFIDWVSKLLHERIDRPMRKTRKR
jgi:DNA-binding transcriptional LysR family regulator